MNGANCIVDSVSSNGRCILQIDCYAIHTLSSTLSAICDCFCNFANGICFLIVSDVRPISTAENPFFITCESTNIDRWTVQIKCKVLIQVNWRNCRWSRNDNDNTLSKLKKRETGYFQCILFSEMIHRPFDDKIYHVFQIEYIPVSLSLWLTYLMRSRSIFMWPFFAYFEHTNEQLTNLN